MQIPTLVWKFTLIFLRYLFACDLIFRIMLLWQSGLFDCKYCRNTHHINADQLG